MLSSLSSSVKKDKTSPSTSENPQEMFHSSVAELRRKAQEHSAALWQLAQSVQQQHQEQQQQQQQTEADKTKDSEESQPTISKQDN